MSSEEGINQEGPLSRESWIIFLSNEIAKLENEARQNSNVSIPIISLFAVAMIAITNTLFSTLSANIPESNKINIYYNLSVGFLIILILFSFYFLFSLYAFIKSLTNTRNARKMKDIRNDVINEILTDTNEIRQRWWNLMQESYKEIFKLDFLNFRFSISRKGQK